MRIFLKITLTVVAAIATFGVLHAQRPAMHEINAANDSIIDEGYTLYLYDKLNWVASDYYREMCSSKTASLSVTGNLNDSLLSTIMIDVEQMKCVFECRLNLNTGDIEPFNLVRGLTKKEIERAQRQIELLEQISALKGIGSVKEAGNLNVDVIEISDKLTRVYLLQGTNKSKLIPFGNDYSIDFDANNNMLALRKYHNSFIPIDFSEKEGNIHKCTHSHLKDNPYITPTDIATFMLYGHDLYGMNTFSVYSTALSCYFTYNVETHSILLVDDEETMQQPAGK